jgi:hypothetical protein
MASSHVTGAQKDSSYTLAWFAGFSIAAEEEVITTRFTVGPWSWTD